MLTFNKKFFFFTILLFIIELLIALFVRDAFVRPYVGDYLVVILIYCAVRTFLKAPVLIVATGVLLFSFLIETLQYFHIVNRLGLENNTIARTVIGTGFEWSDLAAYTLGILTVLFLERKNLYPAKKRYA
jgi:hypothetical protein